MKAESELTRKYEEMLSQWQQLLRDSKSKSRKRTRQPNSRLFNIQPGRVAMRV
jgi:hypothetical protein